MPVILRNKKNKLQRMLHTHRQVVLDWLGNKGYGGTLSDALTSYFKTTSGLTNGTLEDHMRATMNQLGFTGTLSDQLNAYYVDQTGIAYVPDAARAFWNSFGLTFTPGGGGTGNIVTDTSGNTITDADGNTITDTN